MVTPVDIQVEGGSFVLAGFVSHNSNIKVLEYAARGIPAIATDCEVYRSFIRHGENGFLVKQDHEWLRYLSILANDDELRRKMGETARADAAQWTIERNYTRWVEAYESLF
jgi:glycosyltransferase involved in cell wall biosynthesis